MSKKPTEEDIREILGKALEEGRIEFGPELQTEHMPEEFLVGFYNTILGIDYHEAWCSAESELDDFPGWTADGEDFASDFDFVDAIKNLYGVDITPLNSLNLQEVLTYVWNNQKAKKLS